MIFKVTQTVKFQIERGGIQAPIHPHIPIAVYAPRHGHVPYAHSCCGSRVYRYLLMYTESVSVSTNFHPGRPSFCPVGAVPSLYLVNSEMKSVQPY